MKPSVRAAAFFALSILFAVSGFGQWRTAADIREGVSGTIVGTVTDVDEGRNQLQLAADDDRYGRISVVTDSVSTQYNGFGDVINGKPEIYTGGRGFGNVREGDRIEIRGVGRAAGVLRADQITLLGRSVAAPQTGVGETRPSGNISTPTVGSSTTVYGRIEGVVRQVNAADNRVVVETDRREIFNVRTTTGTPVYYRGDVYEVGNLEVGDRVRIETDTASGSSDRELRARTIDVVQSVQEGGGSGGARVSTLSGRVTRIDRTGDVVRIDTGRGEVRVDMTRAYDAQGRRVRAADLQVGDRLDITGGYGASADLFAASTVRFMSEDVFSGQPDANADAPYGGELVTVSLSGTVTETLQNSTTIGIRDRATNRVVNVYATEDFTVRTKSGGYTTADRLNVNDNVLVKAYRDADGNYIAQTIRLR